MGSREGGRGGEALGRQLEDRQAGRWCTLCFGEQQQVVLVLSMVCQVGSIVCIMGSQVPGWGSGHDWRICWSRVVPGPGVMQLAAWQVEQCWHYPGS